MKKDIFISYSRKDIAIVEQIEMYLENEGFSCWRDKDDIDGGVDFVKRIIEGIKSTRMVLYIASRNSYASEYTSNEIQFALEKRCKVLPYVIDDSRYEDAPDVIRFLIGRQNWRYLHEYNYQKLVIDIHALIDKDRIESRLIHYLNGDSYEGECKGSMRHGNGIYKYANGDYYEGTFVNGLRHGQGIHHYANGEQYNGEYQQGKRHGHGCYSFGNGDAQVGVYCSGKEHGEFLFYRAGEKNPSKVIVYQNGEKMSEHDHIE